MENQQKGSTIKFWNTHAHRIAHGVPLCVTVSPDEKKQMLLMIRVSRARRNDLAVNIDGAEFMSLSQHDYASRR